MAVTQKEDDGNLNGTRRRIQGGEIRTEVTVGATCNPGGFHSLMEWLLKPET